ncbi:hypothetical protein N7510_000240 [Penicillium lagena]|uniref:uncharacterized protein n=1 Tax=Penicillium lagena TaxID=94218 RepID=UPI002542108C|nr:uncharacterized protein N7510_000240 [Penicillium lagena]KAJ5623931.1 hypothetical protein N7510_000240 [Penicillium lagena]
MVPPLSGFLQSIKVSSGKQVMITDQLYGEHTISEPVLVSLFESPELRRLDGVHQHGVTGLLGLTPRVTRLEHSVGAFLLVRKVGGSLEEQVTALLHDVSHTALSHVVDWALSKPGEDSFHEVHKERYLKTTQLPELLIQHGFDDLKPFREDLFPLVEMPSPHLCADRLDYGLRDSVAFGKLSLEYAHRIYASLKASPDASSPHRLMVLEDVELALTLARAYLATDRDIWSNRSNINLYQRTGQVIGNLIRRGVIKEELLWAGSDEEFWKTIRSAADPGSLDSMKHLETGGMPSEEGLNLPQGTKIRTIDPDIHLEPSTPPCPLSMVRPEWATERQEYIRSRQSMMRN